MNATRTDAEVVREVTAWRERKIAAAEELMRTYGYAYPHARALVEQQGQ